MDTQSTQSLDSLSDRQLLQSLVELARGSRRAEAALVAHIAEVDARRLFAREACPSMFAYCTSVLHFSEAEAYLRICAARASRRHPVLLEMLADGRLHLSAVARIAPHLTAENRDTLLDRATHLDKQRLLELIAAIAPRPDAPSTVRALPAWRSTMAVPVAAPVRDDAASSSSARSNASDLFGAAARDSTSAVPDLCPDTVRPAAFGAAAPPASAAKATAAPARERATATGPERAAGLEPLAPGRYRVQFTAGAALKSKLKRLQELLHATLPGGDLAALVELAVTHEIERLEARRLAAVKRPVRTLADTDTRPGPRHIPAAVKRAVRERDGDRCAYVDAAGHRCPERRGLEFHHRHPHAHGGDRSPSNVCRVCRAHNGLAAEADYGRKAVSADRRPRAESAPASARTQTG